MAKAQNFGKKTHKKYETIGIEQAVGKTVEAVKLGTVQGAYGDEDSVEIFFADGTNAWFVLASED